MGQARPRIPAFIIFCSGQKLKGVALPAFIIFCSGQKLKGVAKSCLGVASAPPHHTLNEALTVFTEHREKGALIEILYTVLIPLCRKVLL